MIMCMENNDYNLELAKYIGLIPVTTTLSI